MTVRAIVSRSGDENQLYKNLLSYEQLSQLLVFSNDYGHLDTPPDSPEDALDQIASTYAIFAEHDNENSITLPTIHKAKGADRKDVMVLGADELPKLRPDALLWENEQEWNLAYVAVTRAQQRLTLSAIARWMRSRQNGKILQSGSTSSSASGPTLAKLPQFHASLQYDQND